MQVKQFSDRIEIHCGMIEFLPTKTVTQVVAQMLENHPEFRPLIERVDPLYNGNCNIFKMLVKDFPAIQETFADETNKIWAVKAALLEAFNAGVKAGLNMPQKKGQS